MGARSCTRQEQQRLPTAAVAAGVKKPIATTVHMIASSEQRAGVAEDEQAGRDGNGGKRGRRSSRLRLSSEAGGEGN